MIMFSAIIILLITLISSLLGIKYDISNSLPGADLIAATAFLGNF